MAMAAEYTFNSEIVTANGSTFSAIVWPSGWNAVMTAGTFASGSKKWILMGDYYGLEYASDLSLLVRDIDGTGVERDGLGGGRYRITSHTDGVTFSLSGGNNTPFTLSLFTDTQTFLMGNLSEKITSIITNISEMRGAAFANTLAAINSTIASLKGTEQSDLTQLHTDIAVLRGVNNATLSSLLTEDQFDTTMQLLMGYILDIKEQIDKLQAALGAVPYESLEVASVRGLLWSLINAISTQTSGAPPVLSGGEIENGGSLLVEGRVYAMWAEEPGPGVTVTEGGIDLSASDWGGWWVYVQTTDPAPRQSGATIQSNIWYVLSGSGTRNWSVAAGYTIKVYLKPPVTSNIWTINSSFVTITGGNPPRPAIVWPSGIGGTTNVYAGYTWGGQTVLLGNYNGYTVRCLGPNYCRILRYTTPTSATTVNVTIGNQHTISMNTTAIAIDNYQARTTAFTIEFLAP